MPIPKELSLGEETFALHCQVNCLEPLREYSFAMPRKWRFDFAFPDHMLAVEVEGGTHHGGRHSRHDGFYSDCEKYNEAALRGWTVLRFTTDHVTSGKALETVLRALHLKS